MTDLTVIILVGREERHIARCLEKLAPLEARQIVVVESQKGDATHTLAEATARKLGWQVDSREYEVDSEGTVLKLVWHDWPGNQARQFNWYIDNNKIKTNWVLRIDADEYLLPELIEEIKLKLSTIPADVNGVELSRRHYFAGGWDKHGTYPVWILRLYRTNCARFDDTAEMDERLEVKGGVIRFNNDFVDDSLITMDEWREKHRNYAKREAKQALEGLKTGKWMDPRKAAYYRLPPYLRAFMYFCVRYFLKGGFLDGRAGWMWNFWQGLWYRCLVDKTISELRPKVQKVGQQL